MPGTVSLPASCSLWLIRVYQTFLSPFFKGCCRFHPSCSNYAVEAIQRFGFLRGWLMAMWRVFRCNPFTAGGHDPVPPLSTTAAQIQISHPQPRRPM